MLKHFKMYITITDIVGDNKGASEITDDTNENKQLLERTFMNRELKAFVGRKLITTLLDSNDNIVKTDKLTHVMEVVIGLDELHNPDNLEDGRLSNVLLRYHVTGSEVFTGFEPVTPQYKRLKNS